MSLFLRIPTLGLLFSSAVAVSPIQHASQPYVAPGPSDSRGPCPALNTLANHGYINHDGRNLEAQDIINAIQSQLGIEESAVDTALTNAFVVCQYVTGQSCGSSLLNLTLLAEPHAFEHDHSFSREDYKMRYLPNPESFADNQNFNASIFQTSLDVVQESTHVDYSQMNQIRIHREALAESLDWPGWFLESKPIQEFEAGFIFAIMGDFNLPDYKTTPKIRKDWWDYWFTNESLPYELGWHPPTAPRDVNFILSASSAVLAAPATSESPLPTGAIGPGNTAGVLNEATVTTTYALPTFTPYAAPGVGPNDKRKRDNAPMPTAAPNNTTGPTATVKNPYLETLAISDILAQRARATSISIALRARRS